MISRKVFCDALSKKTMLLDGAYGTSFFEMGLGGVPGEILNLEHPDAVERLQREYVEAGADMLLSNTFGANRPKLEENGLADKMREIHMSAIDIARRASAGRDVWVLGDMSSTGRLPRPSGDGSFDECRAAYREQAKLLLECGADAVIVETMTDIKEMKAALVAVREISGEVPLIAQMAFDGSGRTLTGASLEVFAALAEDLDVDVVGMNCLVEPAAMVENLRRLARRTSAFISVEPNAGDPIFDGNKTVYPTGPAEFATFGEEFVELGASIVGGCCGTTPAHIRALSSALDGVMPASSRSRPADDRRVITSRTSFYSFGGPGGFCKIGERINPAGGQTALRDSLRARDWSMAADIAAAQTREGADVLDVNFGVERFFDEDAIADAFIALDRAVSTPLSIDVQTISFLERAMAEYPGRPLINSSMCDEASLEAKLPLLKKYGGMMILLAMDGDIPPTADLRLAAVDRALEFAKKKFGLAPDRFIVDPLVMSIGAGGDPRATLATIRGATERGLLTTMGLSNLSHGMPNRGGINAAFLSRAVEAGASSAIMNTGDVALCETLYGAITLETGMVGAPDVCGDEPDPLVDALLSGQKKIVDEIASERLASGMSPMEVSQSVLGGAMERVGDLYEKKKIFLPHILFAAETAFPVFDRLNAMMASDGVSSRGKVLIATVEGDIHDIGKNIVATVLRAGGFDVVDIGKNVPTSEIVRRATDERPDIVALSAMMTTTVGRVQEVAAALESARIKSAVISGGASMTSELAKMFGVSYSDTSSDALDLCKKLAKS